MRKANFLYFHVELTAGVTYLEYPAVVLDSTYVYAFKEREMSSNEVTQVTGYSAVKPFFLGVAPEVAIVIA